jgi:hypothetical protein
MVQALDQVWVGVAEIALGLVFCFIGNSAARVVLAVWGALVGFTAGSLLYVMLLPRLQGNVMAAVPWWVYSIGVALLLAWLAFAFYTVGVLISMGALGWGLGQALSVTLDMPGWLSVAMALVVAAGLVMVGLTLNLPRVLLIVVTALVGSAGVLDGVQSLMGHRLDWLSQMGWKTDPATHTAWTVGFAVLAAVGMFFQFRQTSEDNLRDAYRRT